jgi:hypothetical protein
MPAHLAPVCLHREKSRPLPGDSPGPPALDLPTFLSVLATWESDPSHPSSHNASTLSCCLPILSFRLWLATKRAVHPAFCSFALGGGAVHVPLCANAGQKSRTPFSPSSFWFWFSSLETSVLPTEPSPRPNFIFLQSLLSPVLVSESKALYTDYTQALRPSPLSMYTACCLHVCLQARRGH